MTSLRRTRMAWSVVVLAVAPLAACGGEKLDTGEPTPPPTAVVVTGTTGAETAPVGGSAAGGRGDATVGKSVFASAGCGGCHTLEAAGSTGTVGPNLDKSKPSREHVVERVTNGKGAMPSFKDELTEDDIRNVAAYVVESTRG